jgi:Zn-dependent peptidase ImmA (M78 family)
MNYKLSQLAIQCRSRWNVNLTDPIDIISIALHTIRNVTLVFLSMPAEINGACFKFDDEKIIFINSKHSELHQRFTIAHEIYHLEFGSENFNLYEINKASEESEANLFASYLLLPEISLEKNQQMNLEKIIEMEHYYKIPHDEFVKRIEFDEEIDDLESTAKLLGYDVRPYRPYTDEDVTMGHYVRMTGELCENNLISNGLKEEFLIDAYCSDLVFND